MKYRKYFVILIICILSICKFSFLYASSNNINLTEINIDEDLQKFLNNQPTILILNEQNDSSKSNLVDKFTTTQNQKQNNNLPLMEPMEPIPMEPIPMEPIPMEPIPMESTPMESTPIESTPMESIPIEPLEQMESELMKSEPMDSIELEPIELIKLEPVESRLMEPVEHKSIENLSDSPINDIPNNLLKLTPEEEVLSMPELILKKEEKEIALPELAMPSLPNINVITPELPKIPLPLLPPINKEKNDFIEETLTIPETEFIPSLTPMKLESIIPEIPQDNILESEVLIPETLETLKTKDHEAEQLKVNLLEALPEFQHEEEPIVMEISKKKPEESIVLEEKKSIVAPINIKNTIEMTKPPHEIIPKESKSEKKSMVKLVPKIEIGLDKTQISPIYNEVHKMRSNDYERLIYEYNKKSDKLNNYKVVARLPDYLTKKQESSNSHLNKVYYHEDYINSLFAAIDSENINVMDQILKILKNDHLQNKDGDNALIYAIRNKKNKAMHYLLKRGFDTKLCNKYGEDAFMVASKQSNYEALAILKNF